MAKSFEVSKVAPQNFEEIFERLGGFGRFQFLILVLLLVFEIPASWISFAPVFVGIPPDSWQCDNRTLNSTENICDCTGTISADSTTVVGEWTLVCSTAWVSDFITSIQMLGMLFGNIYASQLADWYGRKYVFLGVSAIFALGSAVSAAAPNPYVYAFARLLCGIGFAGQMGISAIYTMEFMPQDYRALCGSVGPYGEATMVLGLLAYVIRPWRSLLWVTTSPYILLIAVFPFIPESPRWLIRQNKIDETYKVLKYMARVNGRDPIHFSAVKAIAEKECGKQVEKSVPEKRFSYFDFFKTKDLRRTSICLMAIWFSWSVTYFGLTYNIKNVPGDRYWNVVYLGLTDSIGFPAALLILNRFGRRVSVVFSTSVGAFFLVLLAILQLTVDMGSYPLAVLGLCLLGKFGTAVARSATRCLSGESFPTSIRTMGVGICGIAASFGGVLAPQLAYLGTLEPSTPIFIFAIISVGGSLFAFLLTETTGTPLQEGIARKKSRRISISSILGLGGSTPTKVPV